MNTANPRDFTTSADTRVLEATTPSSEYLDISESEPLLLDCKQQLGPLPHRLRDLRQAQRRRSNAILICHALSGDAHVAGYHAPDDRKPGWWEIMVGPGKGIDTDKYFVICSNVLGGCTGTTGPVEHQSRPPASPTAWTSRSSPIERHGQGPEACWSSISASRGCWPSSAARWAACRCSNGRSRYPEQRGRRHPDRHDGRALSAQSIAFDAVGRNAILADPEFADGQYHDRRRSRSSGLAIARMIGHITYLSEQGMHAQVRPQLRRLRDATATTSNAEFAVETYLRPPGPDLRRAVRRQQLPLHHQGHGLLRPGGGVRRLLAKAFTGHQDALLRDRPSPATGSSRRAKAARSCTRSTRWRPTSASARSSPPTATTPSCSTNRSCSTPSRGFYNTAAGRRGLKPGAGKR